MEEIGEANKCSFCGNECYERIVFDPKTLKGKYELSCPYCRQSLNLKLLGEEQEKSPEELEEAKEEVEKKKLETIGALKALKEALEKKTEEIKTEAEPDKIDWTKDI